MKKVAAICGSTRSSSTNLSLIKAIRDMAAEKYSITIFTGLADLPQFNPDVDHDDPPQAVAAFRRLLRAHDGILICTPEYAMGVPGSLKNAIDWTVSSMEFSKRPTALITASLQGNKAHASLLETLQMIEAETSDKTNLVISFAKTKIGTDNTITDATTFEQVQALTTAFLELMNREPG